MVTLPTLHTSRFVLRPVTIDDLEVFHRLWTNSETAALIKRHPHRSHPQSEERLQKLLLRQDRGELMTWAITAGGPMMGYVGLCRFVPEHRRAEVSYESEPAHRGRGVVAEALEALVGYAFGTLGLHRLEGHVDPDNAPSMRVLERCQFVREGLMRQNYAYDGVFYDTVIYGRLTPSDAVQD